jgi:3-methyladenine DNA glycosylase AlkD
MDLTGVMKLLQAAGSPQQCKVLARHGVMPPMFGVSAASMKALAREIGAAGDQALARQLWESRNHDARVLATMIADPKRTDAWLIDRWRHDLNNSVLCDALSALADTAGVSTDHIDRWCAAGDEWTSALGWTLVARRLSRPGGWSDADLMKKIASIERGIHRAPNRTRYAMNAALIALGLRTNELQRAALAAAKRIGPVQVDHGDTACTTPDAAEYILKSREHRSPAAIASSDASRRNIAKKGAAKPAKAVASRAASKAKPRAAARSTRNKAARAGARR